MRKLIYIALLCSAIVVGFGIRDFNMRNRAVHADESEQASTFLRLFSTGHYSYNPNGPHGPTLYYWTNAIQKLFGEYGSSKLRVSDLRKNVLPFFIFILCAYVLFSPFIGRAAAWGACACFSLSGLACVYSTYFIHEIMFAFLVFCAAAAAWFFALRPSSLAAAIAGSFMGLALATKETAVISFAALALALILSVLISPDLRKDLKSAATPAKCAVWTASFLGAFALCFIPLLSSFGSNPGGILDFISSYSQHFFAKSADAAHEGSPSFYWLLMTLQSSEGARFGELPITILALLGFSHASIKLYKGNCSRESACVFFLALNALLCIIALSFLTYKTPWLILSAMTFVCAVAGYGISLLFHIKNRYLWILGLAFLIPLGYWQYKLDTNAALRYHSDPRNPFLYAHTVSDAARLRTRIFESGHVSQKYNSLPVAFIMGETPWPMPWFLRNYENIGYWKDSIPDNIGDFDIIVTDYKTNANVIKRLNDPSDYVHELYGLRKNLILNVYIKKQLFEKLMNSED